MPEMHIGLIENAVISYNDDGGFDVFYSLDTNAPVINYERKQSPFFWLEQVDTLRRTGSAQMASHENPLMTPSAGSISFFLDENGERKYVSFCQKDAAAPRDPGFRVSRNGYPTSALNWVDLNHLYHESFEEGIFITRSGNELLLPKNDIQVCGMFSDQGPLLSDIIMATAKNLESKTGLKISGTRRADITFSGGDDMLRSTVVYVDEEKSAGSCYSGVVSWTPETGFNFIKFMDVGYPIDELYLVDGETFPNGNPICRDVCVAGLSNLRGKLFGDVIKEVVHKHDKKGGITLEERTSPFLTDKVPRSVLNQVYADGPIYPIHWMDESYAFLKAAVTKINPAYSGIERDMKLKK